MKPVREERESKEINIKIVESGINLGCVYFKGLSLRSVYCNFSVRAIIKIIMVFVVCRSKKSTRSIQENFSGFLKKKLNFYVRNLGSVYLEGLFTRGIFSNFSLRAVIKMIIFLCCLPKQKVHSLYTGKLQRFFEKIEFLLT